MGEGELGEGPAVVCTCEDGAIQAICAADEEDEVFMAAVGADLDELGEAFGGELLTAFVEGYKVVVFI